MPVDAMGTIRETETHTRPVGAPVAIVGPGGCGKTFRLDAWAAAHDGPVVRIVATDLERGVAFGALRTLIGHPASHHEAAAALRDSLESNTLLLVDNAHQLDSASIAAIALLVTDGPELAVAHRPTDRFDVASLDQSLMASGAVLRVGALSLNDLSGELTAVGCELDPDRLAAVHAASGGVVAWAMLLADDADRDLGALAADVLRGPVEHHLAQCGPAAAGVAEILAVAAELPDAVIAAAAQTTTADLRRSLDELATAGLLDAQTGGLYPAIGAAVASLQTTARRRELHARLAAELIDHDGEVVAAAHHMLRSGATGADAAELFTRAGDSLRFRDSARAIEWYDEAAAAGEISAHGVVGRIEAEAHAGQPMLARTVVTPESAEDRARLLAVRAVDELRDGRPAGAGRLFSTLAQAEVAHPELSRDTARLLADVAGSASSPVAHEPPVDQPSDPLDVVADTAHRLAVACRMHSVDPVGSGARFVAAADAFERLGPTFVVPDSPHAIGALHLAAAGDLPGADLLLSRVDLSEARIPALVMRHRLLQAWVHLRSGRYELPVAVLREAPTPVDARDRLVAAALAAGAARRSGDIGRLRDAWATAEPLLLSGAVDLFHLEVVGELLLAAARMRQLERAEPALATLLDYADGADAGSWGIAHAWLLVQLAVECEDASALAAATARVATLATERPYDQALLAAAAAWSALLSTDSIEGPDAEGITNRIEAAAKKLAERSLPWEASRLAGQAAVKVKHAALARRLLEVARQHHRSSDGETPTPASAAGLSERELEIARSVLDGLTHREVGARLYISPKTVEHHVAHIRRKIGATSRAEMIAMLRDLVLTEPSGAG